MKHNGTTADAKRAAKPATSIQRQTMKQKGERSSFSYFRFMAWRQTEQCEVLLISELQKMPQVLLLAVSKARVAAKESVDNPGKT